MSGDDNLSDSSAKDRSLPFDGKGCMSAFARAQKNTETSIGDFGVFMLDCVSQGICGIQFSISETFAWTRKKCF